jgi:hypothetical protein
MEESSECAEGSESVEPVKRVTDKPSTLGRTDEGDNAIAAAPHIIN